MRLQRYLSQAGVASRRRAEQMILDGRVRVNGRVVTRLGERVDPEHDAVEVDGAAVEPAEPVWIALHKPRGVLVARHDPHGRRTVYGLLPRRHRRLFHVGRLDLDSEGLILLTNEGETAHGLLHPRHGVLRVYEVAVRGEPDAATLRRLRAGVQLEDGPARAVDVERVPGPCRRSRGGRATGRADSAPGRGGSRSGRDAGGGGRTWLRLTLAEGRKREVRRMLEAVEHPVDRLIRVRYGPISLGSLPAGRWRILEAEEVEALRAASGQGQGSAES